MILPLRTSSRADTIRPIRAYIAENHIQDPILFSSDLRALDELRNQAISVSAPSKDGITTLLTYAGQLSWLVGKFPVDVGIKFIWTGNSTGYQAAVTSSQNSLRFELFNVLYNLAALYFTSAAAIDKNSNGGAKMACSYFSLAAGVFLHMRTITLPDLRSQPPSDLDEITLETLQYIMLAQAQESVWQKAVRDGLKDATIAKLAAEVIDRYQRASDTYGRVRRADRRLKSHLVAKQHQFEASSRYRMSLAALEGKRYGEEVAWLYSAVDYITQALKSKSYLDPDFVDDLTGAQKKMQADLKQAEKDNDIIYLVHVTPASELPTIARVSMATSRMPPELSEPANFLGPGLVLGKALFADLIPYAVSVAANMYSEMKTKSVDKLVGRFQELTQSAHDQLSAMNLPGFLEAVEKPLGLPPSIKAHADEIRQADSITQLRREVVNTESVKAKCVALFDASVQQLEAEEAEDEFARSQFGEERWERLSSYNASPKLHQQVQECRQYLATSENSDRVIGNKMRQQEPMLKLLSGTDYELSLYVPNSRVVDLPVQVSNAAIELRRQLRELTWLESQREERIESLRTRSNNDEVKPLLVAEARRLSKNEPMKRVEVIQFDAILQESLAKYDSEAELIELEKSRQDEVLSMIGETNSKFTRAREQHSSNSQRERAIQTLEEAYFGYRELVSNVNDARKFYNDLIYTLTLFFDDCSEFVNRRRDEALEMEKAITQLEEDEESDESDEGVISHSNWNNMEENEQEEGEEPSSGYEMSDEAEYEVSDGYEAEMMAKTEVFVPKPTTKSSQILKTTTAAVPASISVKQQQQKQKQTSQPAPPAREKPKNQGWQPEMGIKFL